MRGRRLVILYRYLWQASVPILRRYLVFPLCCELGWKLEAYALLQYPSWLTEINNSFPIIQSTILPKIPSCCARLKLPTTNPPAPFKCRCSTTYIYLRCLGRDTIKPCKHTVRQQVQPSDGLSSQIAHTNTLWAFTILSPCSTNCHICVATLRRMKYK